MPPIRRTYKIVRSEIDLDVELPTLNDGACTIVSLPPFRHSSLPHQPRNRSFFLAPDERPCVAWLDWQGYHAKFFCVFNVTLRSYSRFVMDRRSVDPPVARFDVDIRFSNQRESAAGGASTDGGWVKRRGPRVRDENGNLYMVIEIRVDDGASLKCGKAYGKLMRGGMGEEAVVMTLEEGLDLGCRMEVETVEEESLRVRQRMELRRLEGELVMVRNVLNKMI